jgi:hypothetical protein
MDDKTIDLIYNNGSMNKGEIGDKYMIDSVMYEITNSSNKYFTFRTEQYKPVFYPKTQFNKTARHLKHLAKKQASVDKKESELDSKFTVPKRDLISRIPVAPLRYILILYETGEFEFVFSTVSASLGGPDHAEMELAKSEETNDRFSVVGGGFYVKAASMRETTVLYGSSDTFGAPINHIDEAISQQIELSLLHRYNTT